MSTISAGTTSNTALKQTGDTTGNLVLQTNGTTTAVTIDTSQNVTLAKNLVMSGSTSGSVTIAAPAVAGTQSYTLPTAVPAANGYALTSTTGGTMSWSAITASPAGADTNVQFNNASAFGGSANFAWNNTARYLTITSAGGVVRISGTASSGVQNMVIGDANTAPSVSTGNNIIAIGPYACNVATTNNGNHGFGISTLRLSTGTYNTAVGYSAGSQTVAGNDNVFVGNIAGYNQTSGTGNVYVGTNTNPSSASPTNQIVIGNSVNGQGDSYVTIGSGSGKIYNAFTVSATWTQTSDARLKTNVNDDSLGLSFINRLRPVTFTWKPSNEIDPSLPYYNEVNQRDTTTVIHGLIAQEVKAALDAEGCTTFNGWDAGNDDTIQAISREMFISPLIKAIQELSAANEALTARIAALEAK